MPDSPDQMIYTLQQENKNLKKILKEKEKKLQQKGRELQQISASMTGSMVVSLMLLGVVNAASTICRPKMAVMWYFQ